jgi:transmembrane sensor
MKQGDYQVADFLLNESFQQYVLNSTREDTEFWDAWIKENPNAGENINKAKEIIAFIAARKVQPKHQSVSNEVYERLQKQIFAEKNLHQKHTRKIHIKYYWYAASVILFIGIALLLRYNSQYNIPVNLTGQYLQVIVPVGQRSQLVLPDGTKVWLNSGTVFKYPAGFLQQSREVYLEGEAFFNVTHNKKLPFIVHMKENLYIKVFGTEFNVKCYPTDKVIETTLVKGKIRLIKEDNKNRVIRELNLVPNEKAVYQKNSNLLVVTQLISAPAKKSTPVKVKQEVKPIKPLDEIELITAWKDEALVFHDETFGDIGVKMERWFGMKICIADEDLKQERFTGKFVNMETIYQILDIFNRSEPIQYVTKNKEIIITKRKKQH